MKSCDGTAVKSRDVADKKSRCFGGDGGTRSDGRWSCIVSAAASSKDASFSVCGIPCVKSSVAPFIRSLRLRVSEDESQLTFYL